MSQFYRGLFIIPLFPELSLHITKKYFQIKLSCVVQDDEKLTHIIEAEQFSFKSHASFCRWDVPFFIRTPPKDGQFLHKGGQIFKSKDPPKNEPFGFFSSKGAAKTLRGRNPAIFRGGADKKWNDPIDSNDHQTDSKAC